MDIANSLKPYFELIPIFLAAFLASFLLTPVVGRIAQKIGAVDLPARMRKMGERGVVTRLHKVPIVRLGGLSVIIPSLILIMITLPLSREITGIIIGIIVLCIGGFLDDKYELGPKPQMFFLILATLIVIVAGTGITIINNPFGGVIDMRQWVIKLFSLGGENFFLALPGDLIVFVWIILIINAVKWVFGMDGLGEGVTAIAFFTLMIAGVKYGSSQSALIAVIFMGGILGFLPFNFAPAKIFTASTGQYVYGFLIAVLSIKGDTKSVVSIIVLLIPLIDMLWVLLGRIWREKELNPFKLMNISDQTHLHHRLKSLGLSVKQIVLVEYILVGITSIAAFTIGDFPKFRLISIAIVVVALILLGLSFILKSGLHLSKREDNIDPGNKGKEKAKDTNDPDDTPESRYAY